MEGTALITLQWCPRIASGIAMKVYSCPSGVVWVSVNAHCESVGVHFSVHFSVGRSEGQQL